MTLDETSKQKEEMTMAYTMTVATRIANHGADKMAAQGYQIEAMQNCEGGFYVERGATETEPAKRYLTAVRGEFNSCNCAFYKENRICKHVIFCQRFLADVARYDAIEAQYEDYLNELAAREEEAAWETFAELRGEVQAGLIDGFAWPTCDFHGPYESAANGYPLSWCERCESICM